MKHKKYKQYSESQIAAILKEGADSAPVPELCRTHGIKRASDYKWRSQDFGID